MNKAISKAIDKVHSTVGDPTDEDWLRYGHPLEHCDEKDEAQVRELAALIDKCKRSAGDVHEDAAALAELRKCHHCFNAGKVAKQITEQIAAMEAHERETAELIAKLKADREF